MNNRQKELLKHQLKSEKEILSELKKIYESSLSEIDEKIQILLSDELTQSKIYRVEYQKALKGQVSAILENLNNNQYESVSDYLKDCYEDGFIGTLYDLQGQGIPLIFPINQEEIVEAIILDSKISEGLYTKMGNNVSDLKKRISSEISRGISTASPYAEIARNIRSHANITVNQSMRIVRTEGNRIHNRSALDAALKAKARGADTVKVWDATLDGVTRPHHRQLDGQVRELEEDFEVDGLTACAPLNFGVAAEDCNCRCVLLTKPRWDLDGAFTKRNNETGELMYFDNVKDYYDFKQKYWDYIDNSSGSGIIEENSKKAITPISDKAVERVPKVQISGYTDEQCKFIQSQHQELLKYSRDNNENKEVAFVFDNNLSNRKEFTGSDDKLDFGSSLYGKDLFVMHNHPRNSSYSATDMVFFMQNSNVKSFSIVKNNGAVEVLTKSDKFDSAILKKDFERIIKKTVKSKSISEYDKAVKKLLEKHSQEGDMFEWIK